MPVLLLSRCGEMQPVWSERPDTLLRVEVGPVAEASVGDLTWVVAAWRDVHPLPGDMHMADALLVLQDRDVVEWRPVDRDEVGEAAPFQHAEPTAIVGPIALPDFSIASMHSSSR